MSRFLTSARILIAVAAASALALAAPPPTQAQSANPGNLGFYRFPALHGETLVFAAEGDLWMVPAEGGQARRITTHLGEETHPRISPDGLTLAFTARYEGPAELYTIPMDGGVPVRRTYESDPSLATTWTPDGQLVYATAAYSTYPSYQLVAMDLDGNDLTRVPLEQATEGAFTPDGQTLFFVRPAFHNNVTKRYTGGTARDVWKFEQGADEAVELTGDYDGESHSPMVWRDRVYFVSDRDGTMNVWSMDMSGGGVRQHTGHSGWDVKNPSMQGGRIAYQLGADIWIYDIAADQAAMVPISLVSDFDQLREKWVDDPMDYLTSSHLSPDGDRVVLTARGRVFVAPVDGGRIARASTSEGVRYRDVMFMPDGERLVGLSDASGEFDWVTLPATGVGEETVLTTDGSVLRFARLHSPDGRWLVYSDMDRDLWVVNVDTGERTLVSQDRQGTGAVAWSPDSQWMAYEKSAPNTFSQIKLFRPSDGARVTVTSDRVNSFAPAFHPDGEFLYFLSDRNLRSLVGSPWGPRAPEPFFDRTNEVFVIALREGARFPFSPDTELTADEDQGADGAGGNSAEGGPAATTIDLDGLMSRVKQVPIPAGNYGGLEVTDDALFFHDRQAGQFGGVELKAVAITRNDPEVVSVADRVGYWELSRDGSKVLIRQGDNLHVAAARPARINDLSDARVDLSGWAFPMDVREDWRQIFVDAWRMERDYFYDPDMHGVDWDGVRDKYLALVDRVTTRDELSDLIGRAVGELSALHTSVRGGDLRTGDENVRVASLGARLERDEAAGGYRVAYVYRSDPDYPDEMSPLADPEVRVGEGDVITAVNGTTALSEWAFGAHLRNHDRPVRLTVRAGDGGQSRDVMVTPVMNESNLRYNDWEYTRRLAVEEAGEGDIGYLHMRAMGGGNLTEFYRSFYPVFNRQGLIIDMRRNRGGNIDSIILEKLMRQAWMYWQTRAGEPSWNMQYAFRGHMVVLVDQMTASDGEAFADGFRRLGLGETIGMRTWGGEIWLGSSNRLTDDGLARAPSMGVYGPEGEWLIEQIGFVPDIIVDNLPHETFNGRDAQLEAAIEYLRRKIAEDPRPVPPPPPYPNRGFDYPVVAPDQGPQGSGSGSGTRGSGGGASGAGGSSPGVGGS
jgi:tricorn protease